MMRYNHSNSYPNTATFACLRMPYSAYGMLTPISDYNENTIRKLPKARNYFMQCNGEFPRKHCRKCPAYYRINSETIRQGAHGVSNFAVGSSKTRQITIRGPRKNTTNHDMRPIIQNATTFCIPISDSVLAICLTYMSIHSFSSTNVPGYQKVVNCFQLFH